MAVDTRLAAMWEAKLRAAGSTPPGGSGGGGSGPTGTDVERRLSVLEADVKEMKLILTDIRVTLARLETSFTARLDRVEAEVRRIDSDVKDVLAAAVARTIGPVQFVGIFAACVVIAGAALAVGRWVALQPWLQR